jgi:hypothetical protein
MSDRKSAVNRNNSLTNSPGTFRNMKKNRLTSSYRNETN